jgi:undecaprenyl-diphosphatase
MIEFFKFLDIKLFQIINITNHNSFLDTIFPVLTNFGNFKIPIAIIVLLIILRGNFSHRKNIIIIIAVVLFADLVSSQIMKNIFQRLRPCHIVQNARLLANCSNSFSFPSSHATNISAFAFTGFYFYSRWKYFLLAIAILVCYSRVYVGVHYPFDCLSGALLGVLISLFFIKLLLPVIEKLHFVKEFSLSRKTSI